MSDNGFKKLKNFGGNLNEKIATINLYGAKRRTRAIVVVKTAVNVDCTNAKNRRENLMGRKILERLLVYFWLKIKLIGGEIN